VSAQLGLKEKGLKCGDFHYPVVTVIKKYLADEEFKIN
jgi:hypothetical protein